LEKNSWWLYFILNGSDCICCGSKFCGNYCVTASVDTVNLKPIEVVTMKASVNYVGNSSMIVGIRVESENIQTGTVNHCNSSYFTMVSNGSSKKHSGSRTYFN
jgi:acyl-CoA hydrolase